MAPVKVGERVYAVGDRVNFCRWPSTVVYVNPPSRYWHRYEYQVCMDADPGSRLSDLERTAIGVHSEDLEPLSKEAR